MMNFLAKAVRVVVVGAALMLVTSPALAVSGTAGGTLKYWNKMSQFCPSSRSPCTGAKYLWTDWNVAKGVPYTKVYIRDQNDAQIGMGSSDLNGAFNISWYSSSTPTKIRVTWYLEHKDGRFNLYDDDGTTHRMYTGDLTPVVSGVTNFGTPTWGSSSAPSIAATNYVAAHRFWWDSAYWSSRMQTDFTGVRGYIESNVCNGNACSDDNGAKAIYIGPNQHLDIQNRMLHELGHVMSDISHVGGTFWKIDNYDYTASGCSTAECGPGWGYQTREYYQPVGEEATAQTFANFALYTGLSPNPYICIDFSGNACLTGINSPLNLETSSGTSCASGKKRWPVTQMQLLWDLYDSNVDSVGGVTDSASASVGNFVETLRRFPEGQANRQKLEGWGCGLFVTKATCWGDDPDARNMNDFRAHYEEETGNTGTPQLDMNCW